MRWNAGSSKPPQSSNGAAVTADEWAQSLLNEAMEIGRKLGELPEGRWGENLQSLVAGHAVPGTPLTEFILDPSGTRECPEALLDPVFMEVLVDDAVFGFAYDWAASRVPAWAGGPTDFSTEMRTPRTDGPWREAIDVVREAMSKSFTRAIEESLVRLRNEMTAPGAFVLPPPPPQPYGVSHAGAELLVADWMRHLGDGGALVTRQGGDGGVDVRSGRYIAQVKNYAENVGVEPIRELAGVASVESLSALFFAARGFAPGAVAFADRAGVALFMFDAVSGTLTGGNALGRRIRDTGLG